MGKKGVFEGATNSLILLGALAVRHVPYCLALDSNKREIVDSQGKALN